MFTKSNFNAVIDEGVVVFYSTMAE